MTNATTRVPGPAAWLGGAGLIPFAGLAIGAWTAPGAWQPLALQALAGYGAIILSFMGGCRWGFAAAGLGRGATWQALAVSVLPALYAWPLLLLASAWAGLLLAPGFAALYLADRVATQSGDAPPWWPRLRLPLTLGAVLSLVAGAASTIV